MSEAQTDEPLVKAIELSKRGILTTGSAYSMAAAGLIPAYRVGRTRRGLRFRIDEVIAALRQPAVTEK